MQVIEEINAVAGRAGKVRSLTTDRTKANKISWDIINNMGVVNRGDAVHVHASMVGDLYKLVPWMEENFQKAFKAVDCFRKRSKLSAAFKMFQLEERLHPYVLVKARFERLGSKFARPAAS